MLNNFLTNWIIFIFTIIFTNLIIKGYKYYIYRYLFSFDVSTFIDLNGINLITYITFKNIYSSPLFKWKSKDNFINLFKTVIYLIKYDNIYLNKNLCIIISEFNVDTKLYNVIADPLFINYNVINSPNELFKLIKWTDSAFNDNLNDIVITIKIL